MRSAGADKMRRLCVPGSGSHRAPAPPTPGSYLTGNVFLKINLQTSQQAMHSKQKKNNNQDPDICAKNVDMLAQHPQDQAIA